MNDTSPKPNPDAGSSSTRDTIAGRLAQCVVYGAVSYLILLAVLFVVYVVAPTVPSKSKIDPETLTAWKDVVGYSVPVFAAWVGTILAFYFSKENFEAANRSVRDLVRQVSGAQALATISAKAVMIPRASIQEIKLSPTQKPDDLQLERDILPKLVGKITRVPIFKADDSILCIFHESTVHKTLYLKRKTDAAATPTVGALLLDKEVGPLLTALAFVREDASLADARDEMKKVDGCQDVFVTASGRKDEPVLGWVTNADIAKEADL